MLLASHAPDAATDREQWHSLKSSAIANSGYATEPETVGPLPANMTGCRIRPLDVRLPLEGPELSAGAAGALLRLLKRAGSDSSSTPCAGRSA